MTTASIPTPAEQRERIRALMARWNRPLLRFFRRLHIPPPEHFDLAQDTVLAFIEKIATTNIEDDKKYLWGIANKKAMKFLGRQRRRQFVTFDSARPRRLSTSPSVQLDRKQKLLALFEHLSIAERTAYMMKLEGLTHMEIATAMSKGLATVKRYVSKARRILDEQVKQLEGHESVDSVDLAYRTS